MQPLGQNSVNVPAFLGKLWKMVNDPATDHLISWSPSGTSFIIQNKAHFWYELLPLYYKHNNMSSFVRQLNMYGFHKLSTVENGTMDIDKDEIQFSHPHFQKDQPELLCYIKRKVVTTQKTNENTNQAILKQDDFVKVLTDIKQLRGRQNTVDSQLAAMKQENTVLWRELAMLRQKHIKQQQIVNKLIQFLVSLAHTNSPTRIGVGVKRRMPLMINESPENKKSVNPSKKFKGGKGPTIQEIENPTLPDNIFDSSDEDTQNDPIVNSPASTSSHQFVASPQSVSEDIVAPPEPPKPTNSDNIFLNQTTRNTLLSNIANGSYNTKIEKNSGVGTSSVSDSKKNSDQMTVATRINNNSRNSHHSSRDDLDLHIENSQSEIDSLKELLNGCNAFDANALLGLFNEEGPNYGLSYIEDKGTPNEAVNLAGSELATVSSPLDFNQLFDYSLDDPPDTYSEPSFLIQDPPDQLLGSINTPIVNQKEPFFKDK